MIFTSIYARSTYGRSPTIFQNPHSLSYLLASSIRFPTPAAGERATQDAFDEFLESNAIHAKSPNRVGRDATNDGPDGTAVDIFKTFEISENQDLEDCHYVVTVAVVAASLLADLAAAPKSMQGWPEASSRSQEENRCV